MRRLENNASVLTYVATWWDEWRLFRKCSNDIIMFRCVVYVFVRGDVFAVYASLLLPIINKRKGVVHNTYQAFEIQTEITFNVFKKSYIIDGCNGVSSANTIEKNSICLK